MLLNLFVISGSFISITALVLTIILLIYGKSKLHKIWTLFNLAVLVWGIGCFLAGKASSPSLALFGWRVAISGGLFIGAFFYHTVYIFSEIKKKKTLVIIYFQAILFFLLTILTESTLTGWHLMFNSLYYPAGTTPYIIMILSWTVVAFLGHRELIIFLQKSRGIQRVKARYLFTAFLIGFAGGGPTLLPALNINIYPFGNFGVALYAIIGTYAILHFHLLDINIALTRAGIFAIVYFPIVFIPFWIAPKFIHTNFWWVPTILMGILATLGIFIYNNLRKRAEARLLAEDFRKYGILKRFTAALGRMKDIGLERLLNLIIYRLVKTMRISYGSICLNDEDSNTYIKKASRSLKVKEVIATREELPHESAFIRFILAHRKEFLLEDVQRLAAEEKPKNNQHSNNNHSANEIDYSEVIAQMHQLNARLVIPSFLDKELIGFLVLGEKASGKPYSATDIEVLVVLSRSASLAILNALFTIKLRSRERELADASRIVEIGNLASATEHQLGNVLNNIMNATCGMLDNDAILDSLKNSPEAKAAFERIANVVITNASDGDQIIEEIRSYSRQEEDRQFSLVNLKDVLDKTLSMLYIQINKFQNIDITVTIGPDVPAVLGSPIGLQNIFVNMLNNAYDTIQEMIGYIKLHPEAGMNDYKGKIDVTIRRVKGNVDIHISDNGKGMAPDIARKLFSPHYTTKASSDKRKEMKLSGGTGIGLFTIRFLVKDYGGTITLVKTEPFKGADFLIQLPVPRKEGKGA